jgi:chromosome segregation ATPase
MKLELAMARGGIYKSEVIRARDRLLASGRNPTVDAVRTELGDTGSKTTIHRYLKEIEEEEGGKTGTRIAISESLQDLVGRLAARLQEEADARINELTATHTAREKELSAAAATLREELATHRKASERAAVELASEQQAHEVTQERLRAMELAQTKAQQEVDGLRERLSAEEAHRKSLEEKHQHVQKSLEHFRESAREQREQEARKHEQQTQFLQGEVRTVNQALSAKQNEASTAHQENARLLSELPHAQAATRSAQEESRALKEKVGQLAFAQQKVEELIRQVAELQAENLKLEEARDHQMREFMALASKVRDLEVEVAVRQASIETQREAFEQLAKRVKSDRASPKLPKEALEQPQASKDSLTRDLLSGSEVQDAEIAVPLKK